MTFQKQAEGFVEALQRFPSLTKVFNPWADHDPENDLSRGSADIRADHLARYLGERIGVAKTVMIAEAPGFQGCHFSGIAMTSERILLGHHRHNEVHPEDVFQGEARRSSRDVKVKGFNEPTATVVWKAIKSAGADPRSVVLWNSFAFHPMKNGWLTNRAPSNDELSRGRYLLEHFLSLFPGVALVPIGRVAEEIMGNMKIPCSDYVRHPANGGATKFREGMAQYLE